MSAEIPHGPIEGSISQPDAITRPSGASLDTDAASSLPTVAKNSLTEPIAYISSGMREVGMFPTGEHGVIFSVVPNVDAGSDTGVPLSGYASNPVELDTRALEKLSGTERLIVQLASAGIPPSEIALGMGRSTGFQRTIAKARQKYKDNLRGLDL